MSDKAFNWFQKHVRVIEEFKGHLNFSKMNPDSKGYMKRALEVISALLWVNMILWIELCAIIFYVLLFVKGGVIGKLICIAYATYWYGDRKAAEEGNRGQGSNFVRNLAWYRHFSEFFPVKVVKTAELPATRNYLFGIYPHGVISVGAFCNFATSTTNFQESFPGIRSKLCTLNYHFLIPFYREWVLSWGMISSKRNSIVNALKQSNNKLAVANYDGYTSNAVVLVVGGAQEALYSRPGNYRLVMNKRKGFVKIAIQTGVPLVPVFSFGETEIFDQFSNEPGTFLRAYQDFVKKWTGIAPAMPYARGLLEKSYGLIPYHKPITSVIGAPIEVEQNQNPSQQEIDDLHAKFVEAIIKLYEDYKDKYLTNCENAKLVIE